MSLQFEAKVRTIDETLENNDEGELAVMIRFNGQGKLGEFW